MNAQHAEPRPRMPTSPVRRARPVIGVPRAAWTIASLKWHLILGGIRGTTQQKFQTWMAIIFSVGLGVLCGALLAVIGRGAQIADDLLVVLMLVSVIGVGLLSAATGVEASLDARHLAAEPISRWGLGVGLLAAAAVGPPSLLAVFTGVGVVVGYSVDLVGAAVVGVAVVVWWSTLLLFSRTLANLLGAVATGRFRQLAQAAATLAALLVWLATQVAARHPDGWTAERWTRLADLAALTPPGQIGRAIVASARPAEALVHLLLAVTWLPLLVLGAVWSTQKLALSSPRPGGGARRSGTGAPQRRLRRLVPDGVAGTLARRTIRTKFRTPRQAVNTVTALCVGAGVFFLGPLLSGGDIDPRIVIVGGLLHVAVLFDGNNAFGMDGPALWIEIATGADAAQLVRGKMISSMVVMAAPAVILPISLAALSGGWKWIPVGWLVAAGSVMAASGVAVASATFAPFAMPDSPNPLAAGDTGQGCLAGIMLAVCMTLLVVVSAPVAIAVGLASSRSVGLTLFAALLAPLVGVAVMWAGSVLATHALAGREAEMIHKVTPAR